MQKNKNCSQSILHTKNSRFLHICSAWGRWCYWGRPVGAICLPHSHFLDQDSWFRREVLSWKEDLGWWDSVCSSLTQIRPRRVSMKLFQTKAMQDGKLDWSPRGFYLIWSLTGHSIVFEVSWRVRTKVDYIDVLEWLSITKCMFFWGLKIRILAPKSVFCCKISPHSFWTEICDHYLQRNSHLWMVLPPASTNQFQNENLRSVHCSILFTLCTLYKCSNS